MRAKHILSNFKIEQSLLDHRKFTRKFAAMDNFIKQDELNPTLVVSAGVPVLPRLPGVPGRVVRVHAQQVRLAQALQAALTAP